MKHEGIDKLERQVADHRSNAFGDRVVEGIRVMLLNDGALRPHSRDLECRTKSCSQEREEQKDIPPIETVGAGPQVVEYATNNDG